MNGIEEVEINGVKRGFKFGPRAIALAEREDGCKAGELFKKMAEGDQLAILNIFTGAALDYCKAKSISVDFTSSDVADWIFEMGTDKSLGLLTNGLKTFVEKNVKTQEPTVLPGTGQ